MKADLRPDEEKPKEKEDEDLEGERVK